MLATDQIHVHAGVAMIEKMLGHKKGGAVKWVKGLNWAGNTQLAIQQANYALNSCIQMLEYIAQGHWWCPDHLEQLAKDALPGMRALRGKLEAPIREAVSHIKAFLEDMLGEHAAAVVMTVAANAGSVPRVGVRPRANSAARGAGTHPSGKGKPEPHKDTGGQARTNGQTKRGKIVSATQATLDKIDHFSNQMAGIIGEHMADYHCQQVYGWGKSGGNGSARHDEFNTKSTHKLNDESRMVHLMASKSRGRGIDGVWQTQRSIKPYAIIEAKWSINPAKSLAELLNDASDKSGADVKEEQKKRRGRQKSNTAKSTTPTATKPTNAKGGAMDTGGERSRQVNGKVTQMSHNWIKTRIEKIVLTDTSVNDFIFAKGASCYSRHVLFFSEPHTLAHLQALYQKGVGKYEKDDVHMAHEATRDWGDAAIAKVVDAKGGVKGAARDKRTR